MFFGTILYKFSLKVMLSSCLIFANFSLLLLIKMLLIKKTCSFTFTSCKSQSQQKLAQKITHFTRQFRSKNLNHFTNINPLKIIENILSQHSQSHVSSWCWEKHLLCTISRLPRTGFLKHLESKCLYIPVNLCSKVFVPEK